MHKAPQIEQHNGVLVVRDDLVQGGTKRRVLGQLLAQSPAQEFVYAASAEGYGQLALALAASDTGRKATIFLAARKMPHALTWAALQARAKVYFYTSKPAYLPNVHRAAAAYAGEKPGERELLPLGFNTPVFVALVAQLAKSLDVAPREVWAAAGSGTIISGLQQAWPSAAFHAVTVGRVPTLKGVTFHAAPEAFSQTAKVQPPFASAKNQDAKVWQFVRARAGKGVLFWNVAG
jgi:hypothetical protein